MRKINFIKIGLAEIPAIQIFGFPDCPQVVSDIEEKNAESFLNSLLAS